MLLAGDVGGTKTRLATYVLENGKLRRKDIEKYDSRSFGGLQDIIAAYLQTRNEKFEAACFGVPGPVLEGRVRLPNLPWEFSELQLQEISSISKLRLVNDLVATAAAIPHLGPSELVCLHKGQPRRDQRMCAVVAPGTGLGHAYLYTEAGKYHVIASEGGHIDFAPTDEIQVELFRHLKKKFGRVSIERVICGPGLVNIFEYLRDSNRCSDTDIAESLLRSDDPPAEIAKRGLDGSSDICSQALDLFISILGSHAGNVVLMTLATGGLYLGGGIPPKIAKKFSDPKFLQGFTNKGRFEEVVGATPIYMIADDHAAVVGAASIASQLIGSIKIRTSS